MRAPALKRILLLFLAAPFFLHSVAQEVDGNILFQKITKDGRIRFLKFRAAQNARSRIDTNVTEVKKLLKLGNYHSLIRDQSAKGASDVRSRAQGRRFSK